MLPEALKWRGALKRSGRWMNKYEAEREIVLILALFLLLVAVLLYFS
ncbi:hypothetical protein [Paenibacillus zanthoxyli]|nr:hypothetical protein [Paenibacillus zanthoxyli]